VSIKRVKLGFDGDVKEVSVVNREVSSVVGGKGRKTRALHWRYDGTASRKIPTETKITYGHGCRDNNCHNYRQKLLHAKRGRRTQVRNTIGQETLTVVASLRKIGCLHPSVRASLLLRDYSHALQALCHLGEASSQPAERLPAINNKQLH
jgi:hypothetical protein